MNIRPYLRKIKLSYITLFFSVAAFFVASIFLVLYASGSGKEAALSFFPESVLNFAASTRNTVSDWRYVVKRFPESDLPEYELLINDENLQRINEILPNLDERREQVGFVSGIDEKLRDENREYVPAIFVADGRTYEVEVRYRGNSHVHWSEAKKSLRIRFPKDDLFQGKRNVNFVIPHDRRYLAEEFNHYRARRLGLVVPDSQFVGLSINGDKPSLYWQFEHFGKEFLESHSLAGDANLYGEGDTFQQHIYTDEGYWQKYSEDPKYRDDNFTELSKLLGLLNNATDEDFKRNIFELVDKDNFYKWSAHALLSGSWHQDYSHNARFYFDPTVGKFRFLPWDVFVYDNRHTTRRLSGGVEGNANPLTQRILQIDEFMQERNQVLWEILKDEDDLKKDLDHYDKLYESVQKVFYKDPVRNRSYKFFENEVAATRKDIKRNAEDLRFLFTNIESNWILENNLENNNFDLALSHNQSLSPVYVKDIKFEFEEGQTPVAFDLFYNRTRVCNGDTAEFDTDKNEVQISCDRLNLPPALATFDDDREGVNHYLFLVFRIAKKRDVLTLIPRGNVDINHLLDIEVDVRNSNTDKKVDDVDGIYVDNREFANLDDISLTPQEFVARNSQFQIIDTSLRLPRGVYTFSRNLIIPRGTSLTIAAGTTINLINDASFVSYSPVIAIGDESNPIVVRGEGDGVGENFAVIDNDGLSYFEHVSFSGGGQSVVNGAFFSGMLAIHHADSILRYNTFENAQGDDALNVKYASSTVAFNIFESNSADAIDYDFSDGVIEKNKFLNNGNDSVDTSGSPVLVQFNDIRNSGDKCISVGEGSEPIIFNNILDGCFIGIEVKDLSEPRIINNVFVNNDLALNAYQKKEIFGGGYGRVYNSIIWDNDKDVEFDDVSTFEITNSLVERGYEGKDNTDKSPDFIDRGNRDYRTEKESGGDKEIVKEFLNLDLDEVPVGLVFPVSL